MKLFSNLKLGLGGLALAGSLAVFSGGATAVVIPMCDLDGVENKTCGDGMLNPTGTFLLDIPVDANSRWELEFPAGAFLLVPAGTLELKIQIFDGFADSDFSDLILTGLDGLEIVTGSTPPSDPVWDGTNLRRTWTVDAPIQVHDFHFVCARANGDSCGTDPDSFFADGYLFSTEGVLSIGQQVSVPAPAAAPLLLLGLALTGVGAALRRRPRSEKVGAA